MGRANTSDGRRVPAWAGYLLRAVVVVFIVSLLTLALDRFGWLRGMETAALDRLLILKERVPARDVVIVEIDDADYEQLFHETSPLDPDTVTDILDAVAKSQPRMIAVDLDTSARVFKGMSLSRGGPPVVWARGARPFEEKGGGRSRAGVEVFTPERILGRDEAPEGLTYGIALMPEDADSLMRHFERTFPVAAGGGAAPAEADSFHWAVVRQYCALSAGDPRCARLFPPGGGRGGGDEAGHVILNLSIDPYAFDRPVRASAVLAEANGGEVSTASPTFLALKDKVVILGGKYAASRDFYETPLGVRYGVDLSAVAVESELTGTGIREANHYVLFALEVAAGLALAFFSYYFPHGRGQVAAVVGIPLLALLGSLLAFSSFAMWANFIPTLFAAQVHFLYDKLWEVRRLERELKRLKGGPFEKERGEEDAAPPDRPARGADGVADAPAREPVQAPAPADTAAKPAEAAPVE